MYGPRDMQVKTQKIPYCSMIYRPYSKFSFSSTNMISIISYAIDNYYLHSSTVNKLKSAEKYFQTYIYLQILASLLKTFTVSSRHCRLEQ